MLNLYLVECKTNAGDPCVFPFYYKGIQHYECIKDEDSDSDKTWCATEVTQDGVEEFKWDYCPGNFSMRL